MKRVLANRLSYVGAGIGLALFAIAGLLPGSFIGGVIGLNLSAWLLGSPVEPTIVARIIIGLFMLLGVLVTGAAFVVAGATAGWLVGLVGDALLKPKTEKKEQTIRA
ncbi:MAG: hypothetical protein D6778_08345 [Nitrospirae bacterium]|nr:MAG: hypothetical protein D6778_08345 [Nitrospirota bacterium]